MLRMPPKIYLVVLIYSLRTPVCISQWPEIHVFFFFFQAEDGIRDWSVTGGSDVCSSDLRLHQIRAAVGDVREPREVRKGTGRKEKPLPERHEEAPAERKTHLVLLVGPGAGRERSQIGRASCRERV